MVVMGRAWDSAVPLRRGRARYVSDRLATTAVEEESIPLLLHSAAIRGVSAMSDSREPVSHPGVTLES
jgi:hypothetical protein